MNGLCSNCSTKQEAISIANEHKADFQKIAEETIKENGYNYSVKININNFYFPTKNYGDISLPAGFYDALRVEIGEAKGKNWWCVMFPSLCFIDVSSGIVDDEAKENLEDNLQKESYTIISDTQKPNIKFKFKLIELFAENGLFTEVFYLTPEKANKKICEVSTTLTKIINEQKQNQEQDAKNEV